MKLKIQNIEFESDGTRSTNFLKYVLYSSIVLTILALIIYLLSFRIKNFQSKADVKANVDVSISTRK